MPGISGHPCMLGPRGAKSDPLLNPLRLQTETLTFAKYSQLLQYTANPKFCLEKKKEEAEEDEKENYAYCSESEGLFFSASEEMGTCG